MTTETVIAGIFWVLTVVGAVGAVVALVSMIRGSYRSN